MRSERGQSTVEWVALVLLAALLLIGMLAVAGGRLPGGELARAVLGKILCAARIGTGCGADEGSALDLAYGPDVAASVIAHAPDLLYENGMVALPVDYRRCREPSCSDGSPAGLVTSSASGEPVVAFVHVVDCRPGAEAASRDAGYDCSGSRAGSLYIQYFFYYPSSDSWPIDPEHRGYHEDDWESLQIRITPGSETMIRASSHKGYNYEFSKLNVGSDAGGILKPWSEGLEEIGARPEGGWGPSTGRLYVSGGSHAGNAKHDGFPSLRYTPGDRFRLIPIESLSARDRATLFEVTPPWLKPVYRDPESDET